MFSFHKAWGQRAIACKTYKTLARKINILQFTTGGSPGLVFEEEVRLSCLNSVLGNIQCYFLEYSTGERGHYEEPDQISRHTRSNEEHAGHTHNCTIQSLVTRSFA